MAKEENPSKAWFLNCLIKDNESFGHRFPGSWYFTLRAVTFSHVLFPAHWALASNLRPILTGELLLSVSCLWNKNSCISPLSAWITSHSGHTLREIRAVWVLCSITASVLLEELLDASGEQLLWKAVQKEWGKGSCGTGVLQPSGTAGTEKDATQAQGKFLQAVINSSWILVLSVANSERG